MESRKQEFEEACRALHAGEIGDAEFARRTNEKWRKTGAYLFGRFRRKLERHAAWVEPEDVAQVLAMLALKHVRLYSPARARGKSIGQFVDWTTIHRAQRWIDHARGASLNGNHGKNPSRAETSFAHAYSPETDPLARLAGGDGRDGEEEMDVYAEAIGACVEVREVLALGALRRARGETAEAARLLFGNYAARVELGLRNEGEARQLVCQAFSEVAERVRRAEPAEPPDNVVVLAEEVDRREHEGPPEDLFGEEYADAKEGVA